MVKIVVSTPHGDFVFEEKSEFLIKVEIPEVYVKEGYLLFDKNEIKEFIDALLYYYKRIN
jgi:hypothetical protein